MGHQMPPDDDPIIRSIREAGVRPLRPGRVGQSSIAGRHPRVVIAGLILLFVLFLLRQSIVAGYRFSSTNLIPPPWDVSV